MTGRLFLLGVLLAVWALPGCGKVDDPVENVMAPTSQAEDGAKTMGVDGGLTIEGDLVLEIPGQSLSLGEISPPDLSDEGFARSLEERIGELGLAYLKEKLPHDAFSLSAARQIGEFILLHYTWEDGEDGNAFLVYSLREGKIMGRFAWYEQG